MTPEQQKQIEDALEHLGNNLKGDFKWIDSPIYGKIIVLRNNDYEPLYQRFRDIEKPKVPLSLESIREIGQKIGYEVWAVRTSGTTNDKFLWIGYSAEIDSFEKQPTDDYPTFYEAMLEALISAIYDKFPKEQQ